jgi:hypothetical protein
MTIATVEGAAVVGGGSTLHPASKAGSRVEILCKCAAALPREGRPPVRFMQGLRPNCRGAKRILPVRPIGG